MRRFYSGESRKVLFDSRTSKHLRGPKMGRLGDTESIRAFEISVAQLQALEPSSRMIIDVRGDLERRFEPSPSGSVVMKPEEIERALRGPDSDFVTRFGRPKPRLNHTIVIVGSPEVSEATVLARERAARAGWASAAVLKDGARGFHKAIAQSASSSSSFPSQ